MNVKVETTLQLLAKGAALEMLEGLHADERFTNLTARVGYGGLTHLCAKLKSTGVTKQVLLGTITGGDPMKITELVQVEAGKILRERVANLAPPPKKKVDLTP